MSLPSGASGYFRHNHTPVDGTASKPDKGHTAMGTSTNAVRVTMDMDKGALSFSVNGEADTVAFTGIAPRPLYPAFSVYATGCTISVLESDADRLQL